MTDNAQRTDNDLNRAVLILTDLDQSCMWPDQTFRYIKGLICVIALHSENQVMIITIDNSCKVLFSNIY